MVKDGRSVAEVARHLWVSRQILYTWIKRFDAGGGIAALADRSRTQRSRRTWRRRSRR